LAIIKGSLRLGNKETNFGEGLGFTQPSSKQQQARRIGKGTWKLLLRKDVYVTEAPGKGKLTVKPKKPTSRCKSAGGD